MWKKVNAFAAGWAFSSIRGEKVSVDSVKSKEKCVPSSISSFISQVCAVHLVSQDHPRLRENVIKIANLLLLGP